MGNRLDIEITASDAASGVIDRIQKKISHSAFSGLTRFLSAGFVVGALSRLNAAVDDYVERVKKSGNYSLISREQIRDIDNATSAIGILKDRVLAYYAAIAAGASKGGSSAGGPIISLLDKSAIGRAFLDNPSIGPRALAKSAVGNDDAEATLKRLRDDEAEMQAEAKKADKDRIDAASERASIVARARKDEEEDRKKAAEYDQKRIDAAQERASTVERIRSDEEAIRRAADAASAATSQRARDDEAADRSIARQKADIMLARADRLTDRAARLREDAFDPASVVAREKQDRRLQRLAERGGEKLLEGRKLSRSEMSAVESVSAAREAKNARDQANEFLKGIKNNTDFLKANISPGA